MGRWRLNQVVEGRQLGGIHRLLLLQDVLKVGVGQGPIHGVRRGKGGCEVLSLSDLGTTIELRAKAWDFVLQLPPQSTRALNCTGQRSVLWVYWWSRRVRVPLALPLALWRWVVRLSATNRSWVIPFGGKSVQFGGKSVQGLFADVHVDFIVFSSLFRVLFVLPVGLARLDVFPFSFRRLECSCHPSQSTKGDLSICWAPGRRLSSAFRSVQLFFFRFFESLSTCCLLFRCGGSFRSFLVDWSSFPTPPNRKFWLLEPICIRRGVLYRLRLVHFLFFERTASGSVCAGGCHWRPPDGCELSAAPC